MYGIEENEPDKGSWDVKKKKKDLKLYPTSLNQKVLALVMILTKCAGKMIHSF